ncbi:MAG: CZB domain-containing protein [Magnetococcus sp. DMHC-6]
MYRFFKEWEVKLLHLGIKGKTYAVLLLLGLFAMAIAQLTVWFLFPADQNANDVVAELTQQKILSQRLGKTALSYLLASSGFRTLEEQVILLDEYINDMRAVYLEKIHVKLNTNKQILSLDSFTGLVNRQFSKGKRLDLRFLSNQPMQEKNQLQDGTDWEALTFFREGMGKIYNVPFGTKGKNPRVYTALRVTDSSCIACHNQAVKKPLAVGDLLGVGRYILQEPLVLNQAILESASKNYEATQGLFNAKLTALQLTFSLSQNSKITEGLVSMRNQFELLQTSVQTAFTAQWGSELFRTAWQNLLMHSDQLDKICDELIEIQNQTSSSHQILRIFKMVGMAFGLVLTAVLLAAAYLKRLLLSPLSTMAKVLDRVSRGHRGVRIHWEGNEDEMGQLANSINRLTESHDRMVRNLMLQSATLHAIVEEFKTLESLLSRDVGQGEEFSRMIMKENNQLDGDLSRLMAFVDHAKSEVSLVRQGILMLLERLRAQNDAQAIDHSSEIFSVLSRMPNLVEDADALLTLSTRAQGLISSVREVTAEIFISLLNKQKLLLQTVKVGENLYGSIDHAALLTSILEEIHHGLRDIEDEDTLMQPPFDIGEIKLAHLKWFSRLAGMVRGRMVFSLEEVGSVHECDLGKWYDTEGREHFGKLPLFHSLGDAHQEVHDAAREMVSFMKDRSNREEAIRQMALMNQLRKKLFALLNQLFIVADQNRERRRGVRV